jgi:hypothetical protein
MKLKNELIEVLNKNLTATLLKTDDNKIILNTRLSMSSLKDYKLPNFSDEIQIGSLVTLKTNDIETNYFVLPISNTHIINHEGKPYIFIGPDSLMASYMIHLQAEDDFDVELSSGVKNYKILKVI